MGVKPSTWDAAAIERVASGLLDLSFPYEEWGHAAHFAAALWLLRNPTVLAGRGGMETILRCYNKAVGIPDVPTRGYHATITQASMSAAASVLDMQDDAELPDVLGRLLEGECGDRDWLLAYWSRERLMSLDARRKWLDPDLAAFPYDSSRTLEAR